MKIPLDILSEIPGGGRALEGRDLKCNDRLDWFCFAIILSPSPDGTQC